MNNGLDRDVLKTTRVNAMYSVTADSKRFVAQREADLEAELDTLLKQGKKVKAADVQRIGKQIVEMCKPVTSDTYVRLCRKYIKISNAQFTEYKRIKDIWAYEEKYRNR